MHVRTLSFEPCDHCHRGIGIAQGMFPVLVILEFQFSNGWRERYRNALPWIESLPAAGLKQVLLCFPEQCQPQEPARVKQCHDLVGVEVRHSGFSLSSAPPSDDSIEATNTQKIPAAG